MIAAVALALTLLAPAAEGATLQQRVKKLERKVRTLQALTTNLSTRLRTAEGWVVNLNARVLATEGTTRCLGGGVPVTSYGDLSGAYGYVFDNNDGLGEFLTSALDYSGSGEVPDYWVATYSGGCMPTTARTLARAGTTSTRPQALARPTEARHKARAQGM